MGTVGGIGAGAAIILEGAGGVTAPAIAPTAVFGLAALNSAVTGAKNLVKASSEDDKDASSTPEVSGPYKRPSYSVTPKQRQSVQGKPCVTCGKIDGKRIADHKDPLVVEHYTKGKIDKKKMREIESVQPQCETCSAKQGAEMSKFSKEQKKKHGFE